jgi:hypothetical protein
LWIRIRIKEGKNDPKIFPFFEVLDVLFGGLKASPVAVSSIEA